MANVKAHTAKLLSDLRIAIELGFDAIEESDHEVASYWITIARDRSNDLIGHRGSAVTKLESELEDLQEMTAELVSAQ